MKNPTTALTLLISWFFVSCSNSDDHNSNKSESTSVVEDHPAVAHLSRIVIPKVDISDATPEEAFDFVRQCAMENDNEPDMARKGVSMIVRGHVRRGNIDDQGLLRREEKIPKINCSAENMPFLELLAEVARQARVDVYLTSIGFIVVPEGASPFPNTKSSEGEIWKIIRQTEKQRESTPRD